MDKCNLFQYNDDNKYEILISEGENACRHSQNLLSNTLFFVILPYVLNEFHFVFVSATKQLKINNSCEN